jgi:hypothetical protein
MPISAITPSSATKAERPAQQQQGPGHTGNAQRPGQEHQHGPAEAVQLQHQQREGDEQHDRHPAAIEADPLLLSSTAPATSMR